MTPSVKSVSCITAVSAGLGRVAKYMQKKVEQKNTQKTQHMLYFLKAEG